MEFRETLEHFHADDDLVELRARGRHCNNSLLEGALIKSTQVEDIRHRDPGAQTFSGELSGTCIDRFRFDGVPQTTDEFMLLGYFSASTRTFSLKF